MSRKESFVLYTSHYDAIRDLTAEQKGTLLDAIFRYVRDGEEDDLKDGITRMAFNFIRLSIDRENAKYTDICDKRSAAQRLRWERRNRHGNPESQENPESPSNDTKDTNEYKCIQMKVYDNDNDNDNDNDTSSLSVGSSKYNDPIGSKTHTHTACACEKSPGPEDEFDTRCKEFLHNFNNAVRDYGAKIKLARCLDEKRRAALKEILKSYAPAAITLAVRNMMLSDFANGRTPRRKTPCDIDWLLKPENFKHFVEGSL